MLSTHLSESTFRDFDMVPVRQGNAALVTLLGRQSVPETANQRPETRMPRSTQGGSS